MDRDEELEDKVTEVNTRLAEAAEPDAREQAPAAVKRQAKQREEGQADKRETDPEYLAKLEDFKRAQEALRLKQENFQRRQREYEARKAAKLAEKEARVRALSQQQADFLKKRAERGKADHLARGSAPEDVGQKAASTSRPAPNKLQRYQSEQRTKQAPLNLARIGAQRDVRGLAHVGEKGTKAFFQQRKRNILSLNRAQYGSQGDEVKMDVGEYNAMLNERDGGDRAEGRSQSPRQGAKGPKLPAISMSLKADAGAEGKGKSYAASTKVVSGRGASKGDGLYKTGLKSTGLVI